jgi:hypothetical protein
VEKLDDFENKTFEHRKKSDVTEQKGDLLPLRPIWLQALEQVRTFFLNQLLVPVSPDSIDVSAIFGYLKNAPVVKRKFFAQIS